MCQWKNCPRRRTGPGRGPAVPSIAGRVVALHPMNAIEVQIATRVASIIDQTRRAVQVSMLAAAQTRDTISYTRYPSNSSRGFLAESENAEDSAVRKRRRDHTTDFDFHDRCLHPEAVPA